MDNMILCIQILTKWLICWGAGLFLVFVAALFIWNLTLKKKIGSIYNLIK